MGNTPYFSLVFYSMVYSFSSYLTPFLYGFIVLNKKCLRHILSLALLFINFMKHILDIHKNIFGFHFLHIDTVFLLYYTSYNIQRLCT